MIVLAAALAGLICALFGITLPLAILLAAQKQRDQMLELAVKQATTGQKLDSFIEEMNRPPFVAPFQVEDYDDEDEVLQ